MMDAWLQNNLTHDLWTRALVALIDSEVKGLVLLALAAGVTAAMRRASAASRHLVWALAMGALLLLPALSLVSPKWQLPILPPTTRPAPVAQMPPAPPSEPARTTGMAPAVTAPLEPVADVVSPAPRTARPVAAPASVPPAPSLSSVHFPLSFWLLAGWLAVALALLLPLLAGLAAVARLMRNARPFAGEEWPELTRLMAAAMGVRQPVRYLCTGRAVMPMATGQLRPAILLPPEAEAWPEEKRRAVLLHELAHVKRRDCLTHALARLGAALHWPNPLAWLALRRMRIERERACDDLVLIAGEQASDYADQLLDIARTLESGGLLSAAAITMAKKSQIEGRLLAILDATRNRRGVTRRGLALGLLLFCLTVLPFAAVELGKRGPAGPPQLKVAVWSVFVGEPVARALQGKGTALAGKTEMYQGYAMESKALAAVLKDGEATSQVLCIPRTMVWLENCDPRTGHKVLSGNTNICSTVKIGGNHLFVIDLPTIYMLTAKGREAQLEWQGSVRVYDCDNDIPKPEEHWLNFTGALNCGGDLKAGEAHVYLAPLAPPGDAQAARTAVRQLIAVQAVEIGAEDAPGLAAFVDLECWLQDGPASVLNALHAGRNPGRTVAELEGRSQPPATPNSAAGTSATAASASNNPWRKLLPNGVEVELVYIGVRGDQPAPWWRPDGTLIPLPEDTRIFSSVRYRPSQPDDPGLFSSGWHRARNYIPPLDPAQREVYFKVRYTGKQTETDFFQMEYALMKMPSGKLSGGTVIGPYEEHAMLLEGDYPSLETSQTLGVKVAYGPWTVLDTYKPGTPPVTKTAGDFISSFTTALASDRGLRVSVSYNRPGDGRFYRLAALRKDGTLDTRGGGLMDSGATASQWMTLNSQFHIPIDAIEEFQLQVSDYQWAEFPVPAVAVSKPGPPPAK